MRSTLIITLLAGTGFGQTSEIWKMNPEKSRHNDEEPLPRSFVIRREPHPEGEAITVWRVMQDGRSETDSIIERHDGKDRPHPREERFDSFNARKIDGETIEITFKKNGKIVGRQLRRVTANGNG